MASWVLYLFGSFWILLGCPFGGLFWLLGPCLGPLVWGNILTPFWLLVGCLWVPVWQEVGILSRFQVLLSVLQFLVLWACFRNIFLVLPRVSGLLWFVWAPVAFRVPWGFGPCVVPFGKSTGLSWRPFRLLLRESLGSCGYDGFDCSQLTCSWQRHTV